MLRVERTVRMCVQGKVKEVPCSAGLHFVLRVRSPLEDCLGVYWVRAQVTDMEKCHRPLLQAGDRPLGHPRPRWKRAASTVQLHSK